MNKFYHENGTKDRKNLYELIKMTKFIRAFEQKLYQYFINYINTKINIFVFF